MRVEHWLGALLLMGLCAGCAPTPTAEVEVVDAARPIKDLAEWNRYLADAAKADRIIDPVARCVAYPDLPGNAWVAGSARARCQLLREPPMRLEQITSLLAQRNGAALMDERFRVLLEAHYKDPAQREMIFTAYAPFFDGEAGHDAAEAWHARLPGSPFAQTAIGALRVAAAVRARGGDFSRITPDEKMETMARLFGQAVEPLLAALRTEPRLSVACERLMQVGRWSGDRALADAATSHCLRVDPLSWNVRHEWQRGLDPRWGGSIAALEASVEELRPLARQNPALGAMLSRAVGVAAYVPTLTANVPLTTAAAGLEEAARLAPDAIYIAEAGRAAQAHGDQRKALGYLTQAVRLAPDERRFIAARAQARLLTGDRDGAIVDATRAIDLGDGSDVWPHTVLGQALLERGRVVEARASFETAMQDASYRQSSFQLWCETFTSDPFDGEGARSCTEGLVKEYPEDSRSLYLRAWVLYRLEDAGADDAAAEFRKRASRTAPADQKMLAELADLQQETVRR